MVNRTLLWGLGLLSTMMAASSAQQGDVCDGPGLTLCLHGPSSSLAGHPINLRWEIVNTTRQPVRLASHVEAGPQRHFDNLDVRVCGPMPAPQPPPCRDVPLSAARMASVPVDVELLPGQKLAHAFDLAFWLTAQGITLAPGTYSLQAVYRRWSTNTSATQWTGELRSRTIPLQVMAAP